jgi:hypothetical protein
MESPFAIYPPIERTESNRKCLFKAEVPPAKQDLQPVTRRSSSYKMSDLLTLLAQDNTSLPDDQVTMEMWSEDPLFVPLQPTVPKPQEKERQPRATKVAVELPPPPRIDRSPSKPGPIIFQEMMNGDHFDGEASDSSDEDCLITDYEVIRRLDEFEELSKVCRAELRSINNVTDNTTRPFTAEEREVMNQRSVRCLELIKSVRKDSSEFYEEFRVSKRARRR